MGEAEAKSHILKGIGVADRPNSTNRQLSIARFRDFLVSASDEVKQVSCERAEHNRTLKDVDVVENPQGS